MAKNFSLKEYEAQLEKDANESKEYWNSEKGKQRIKNNKSKQTPEMMDQILKLNELSKALDDRLGRPFQEYFKEFRDKSALECEKIFESMKDLGGFIKPYDSDELAGFFIWIIERMDFYTELPDRSIYFEFDKYQKNKIKDGPTKYLDDEETNTNKSLGFIDDILIDSFLNAEKKAFGKDGKFQSEIRCAAFCEMLYSNKYIRHTKTRQKTINDFAKSRYGIVVSNALLTSKKANREKHKTNTVSGLKPLKNCF